MNVINNQKPYNAYSSYIRTVFGGRVQKISINTGYSCPNRDGTKGVGGCTYCNINSIKPAYANAQKTITEQLKQGITFFSKKYITQKYLAYFQSYTNTYQKSPSLVAAYQEALSFPGVVGLVIATRPDCINEEMTEIIKDLSKDKYISVELGLESTNERTLEKINRCHTYQDSVKAVEMLAKAKINVGAHIILGFPWENHQEAIIHSKNISKLPLNSVKLHHLQILKYTQLAKDYSLNEKHFPLLNPKEYLDLIIEFLENLNPRFAVQRFISESPLSLLIAPHWGGIKNYEFADRVEKKMMELQTFQGRCFEG